jgi:hypothetical protein
MFESFKKESQEVTPEKIDGVLQTLENENKAGFGGWYEKNKINLKGWARRVVVGMMLSGPLLATGCNKSEGVPEKVGAPAVAENVQGKTSETGTKISYDYMTNDAEKPIAEKKEEAISVHKLNEARNKLMERRASQVIEVVQDQSDEQEAGGKYEY